MGIVRSTLLMASQNSWLREKAPRYEFIRRSVERFLPGESMDDALGAARRLADSRIGTLLTHLGENVNDPAEAEAVTGHYLQVLDRIRATGLPSEISVKLTQLGLDLDAGLAYANLARLIAQSPPEKTVWIDMEQSPYVDVTLELYRKARAAYPNVGICVQAYLYRTEKDLAGLIDAGIDTGATVRLVKGAYNEPSEIAFPKKADVDESYHRLAQMLLSPEARRRNVRAALATHDVKLISRISDWAASQAITPAQVEFAMLYGIQRAEQMRLAKAGYRCSVLVSYGSYWFPWFVRRLAERPANLLFLARNLFSS